MVLPRTGISSIWAARAVGGAGLVIAEASGVEARGRITHGCLGIWKDEHIPMLAAITEFCREQGAAAGMQIAHAGRKANVNEPWLGDRTLQEGEGPWEAIAPMAEPFDAPDGDITHTPCAMTQGDITDVIEAFSQAAHRSVKAGFDLVEIHTALTAT